MRVEVQVAVGKTLFPPNYVAEANMMLLCFLKWNVGEQTLELVVRVA